MMKALNAIIIGGLLLIKILIASGGKISGVTYFEYFVDADRNSEFEIHRSYFTYTTEVSEAVHFKFQLDVGRLKNDEANQQLFAYIKNSRVDWKSPFGKLTFGLQGMNIFDIQEKNWGYRFIEKSPMDLNKWASSADLGIGYAKSFGSLQANLLVTNGPGYKKSESDKYKKISGQIFLGEKKLLKTVGYNTGAIFVFEPVNAGSNTIIGVFAGYAGQKHRLGAEWERLQYADRGKQLISLYGNYQIIEKTELFGRFDQLDDDRYFIIGANFQPDNGLMVAPNVRYSKAGSGDSELEYRVNFLFKF